MNTPVHTTRHARSDKADIARAVRTGAPLVALLATAAMLGASPAFADDMYVCASRRSVANVELARSIDADVTRAQAHMRIAAKRQLRQLLTPTARRQALVGIADQDHRG